MRIPFNIWDDYYDDGYVPIGEIQETYGFVEEYDRFSEEEKENIIKVIYDYIVSLGMDFEVELSGTNIDFKHMTHKQRERLLKILDESGLRYNGINIDFYSES